MPRRAAPETEAPSLPPRLSSPARTPHLPMSPAASRRSWNGYESRAMSPSRPSPDCSTSPPRRCGATSIRLDEAGLIQRFHGGAGQRENTARPAYSQKRTISTDAKRAIAEACARMIPDGASVCLDVGTTVEAVARALLDHRSLHVVTTSVGALAILAGAPVGDVVVTGGLMRGADGSLVGEQAIGDVERPAHGLRGDRLLRLR